MSDVAKPKGMDRALVTKVSAKYDMAIESQVREWIQAVVEEDIGTGANEVERRLRNGQILVKLANAIYDGTSNLPPACHEVKRKGNTSPLAFKQMENIEIFLGMAEAYGLPKTSLFPTADLFDGKNMAMVIATILQLGTEAQRHGFSGQTCGPKPTEKHEVEFTTEQLKAGETVVTFQAGTNKLASQKGMRIGSTRHISDIRADDCNREGQGVIGLQSGSNQFASQKGMSIGSQRHVNNIKVVTGSQEGQGLLTLQTGTNEFASQKGMTAMGAVRHISDIRADDMNSEGKVFLTSQTGTNQFASQRGMTGFGAVRHVSDIRADEVTKESQGQLSLQAGTNNFASQKGMSAMGAVRHISDIRADDLNRDGQGMLTLQGGTNKFASQKGMAMGSTRHIADLRVDPATREGQSVLGAQTGWNRGASQKGMSFGTVRHIHDIKVGKEREKVASDHNEVQAARQRAASLANQQEDAPAPAPAPVSVPENDYHGGGDDYQGGDYQEDVNGY